MIFYAIRRALAAIPLVAVASFVMFMLVSLAGDPLAQLKSQDPPPAATTVAALERELRLDRPVLERYGIWVSGVVTGDFGPSVQNLDIGTEIRERVGVTGRLVFLATVIAAFCAIVFGVLNAVGRYSVFDHVSTFVSFLFLSTPLFWLAAILKNGAIGINDQLGHTMFYTVGDASSIPSDGFWETTLVLFGVLALPTLALSLNSVAKFSRYARASMLDVLDRDYVTMATAKGLRRSRVIIRHGLRTALIPFVTVLSLEAGEIIGGAVVTEYVFQWRGMGDLLLTSIRAYDVYAVLGWLLVASTAVIIFNLIADLLYGALDPRIRRSGSP